MAKKRKYRRKAADKTIVKGMDYSVKEKKRYKLDQTIIACLFLLMGTIGMGVGLYAVFCDSGLSTVSTSVGGGGGSLPMDIPFSSAGFMVFGIVGLFVGFGMLATRDFESD